jgi:hypothetical protein
MSDELIQILRTPPKTPAPVLPGGVEWPVVTERLQQYAAARGARTLPDERCELCGAAIEAEHGHVANLPTRTMLCVCRPCYLLFMHDGAGGARFRAIPERYLEIAQLAEARDEWEALQLPIGLAFFFRNSTTGRTTAFYPSPAGATESELPLDTWDALTRAVPLLAAMSDDVEALIVRRRGPELAQSGDESPAAVDAFIVPIDACYELVGRIRQTWRGFQGGDAVWNDIDGFFAHARERAQAAA